MGHKNTESHLSNDTKILNFDLREKGVSIDLKILMRNIYLIGENQYKNKVYQKELYYLQ